MGTGKGKSLILTILIILFITTLPSPVLGEPEDEVSDPSANAMITDFFIVRPTYFIQSIIGFGMAIVTLPFTLAADQADHAAKKFVEKPLQATFGAPLGDPDAMANWPSEYD
jgi:hypothetical protein